MFPCWSAGYQWADNFPLSVCCGTNELLSYLTGVLVIIVHHLKNVNNISQPLTAFFCHLPFSSGATSPTSTVDPVVPPPKVPKLLPVLKRSNSTQETSEPVVPPGIPKLLPVLKRSHSSQGVTEPVAASPPPVKVKQEKPESPMDFSPCQESMQKVCGQLNMKLLVFVF